MLPSEQKLPLQPVHHTTLQQITSNQVTQPIQMDMSRAVELLNRSERVLTVLGVWPQTPNDARFVVILSYLITHVSLEYADLFQFMDSLEHVVANLTENIMFTAIVIKVILLRLNNRKLGRVLKEVNKDFREDNYKTPKEKEVFLAYYKYSRTFVSIAIPLVVSTAGTYYLAPLGDLLASMNQNGTIELTLPYHTRMFYDASKIHTYILTYLAQLPFVFVSAFGHTGADCLLVTLMLHVCGQLSVLVERIDGLSTEHQECGPAIGELVRMHVRLISMATTLKEAFNVILLTQLIGEMGLMCLLSYNILANAEEGQKADFVNFVIYISGVVLLIYAYCYVGESLIGESARVHDAFSKCRWEDMSKQDAKSIIICLARSQQPLELTAGQFYKFSLSSFTDIMKTSMAYLSVLRNLL